jgi:hypothetical protein
LVKEVTYLKEDRYIEVSLVLPHPDVPLRLMIQRRLAQVRPSSPAILLLRV